jgi:anti-anti-sigma factor
MATQQQERTVADQPAGCISVVDEGGVPVLRLAGEIDEVAVATYRDEVAGAAPAVVDVSAVTFLDCRGLRFLVRQTRGTRRAGGVPVLRRPPRVVRRLLEATGSRELFSFSA